MSIKKKRELKRCPSSLADATNCFWLLAACSVVTDLFSSLLPRESKNAHKTWLKNSRRNVSHRTCACGTAHQRTRQILARGYTDTKYTTADGLTTLRPAYRNFLATRKKKRNNKK